MLRIRAFQPYHQILYMLMHVESSRYIVYKINYIQWYACRSSRYKMHTHVHMFLPVTSLIFNGFSIRKKFWNAENQGFSTIPSNSIYVDACRSSRYIVYKINYIQWYACRRQSIHCVLNKVHSMVRMSKQSIHCVLNKLHSMVRMSKQLIHCVRNTLHSMACMSRRSIQAFELHCVS